MPDRMLKESITTSENINALTYGAEVFFYRLLVHVDDYGLIDGRASVLRSLLFPLRDLSVATVEGYIKELCDANLVSRYVVGEKPYLEIRTFLKHQTLKFHKRGCPPPIYNINNTMDEKEEKKSQEKKSKGEAEIDQKTNSTAYIDAEKLLSGF